MSDLRQQIADVIGDHLYLQDDELATGNIARETESIAGRILAIPRIVEALDLLSKEEGWSSIYDGDER